MQLNTLKSVHPQSKAKRVGRGIGSGKGKTCGRGVKGQKSRTGVTLAGFEGGQNPLYRRLPKRGFNNIFADTVYAISTRTIGNLVQKGRLKDGDTLDIKILKGLGLIKSSDKCVKLKIIGSMDINASLNISAHMFSKGAQDALKKSKCTLETINN